MHRRSTAHRRLVGAPGGERVVDVDEVACALPHALPASPPRLARQLEFILELDRLKRTLRQTLILDASRQENSAEHSWHLALMAVLLEEYAAEPVDVGGVVKMVLVPDVVVIDGGETFW